VITAKQASNTILTQGRNVNVIPVLVIDDVSIAADLAKVLVDAGMPILEVTMRTKEALPAMEKMAAVDGAIVAAGTVLNADHVVSAQSAGAQFLVSPGYSDALGMAALERDLPLLPGAATATEVMILAEKGYELLKFFPAEINGGIAALKALSGPFPDVSFCPTGGVNVGNVNDYLSLKTVEFVGGSWLVTKDDIQEKNWDNIQKKAQALQALLA
jgi:2-dehydro-3-deoxyphosphogluconate aldolase/(4S)-4-hydroxy-2-oxoglutarate aldolase